MKTIYTIEYTDKTKQSFYIEDIILLKIKKWESTEKYTLTVQLKENKEVNLTSSLDVVNDCYNSIFYNMEEINKSKEEL